MHKYAAEAVQVEIEDINSVSVGAELKAMVFDAIEGLATKANASGTHALPVCVSSYIYDTIVAEIAARQADAQGLILAVGIGKALFPPYNEYLEILKDALFLEKELKADPEIYILESVKDLDREYDSMLRVEIDPNVKSVREEIKQRIVSEIKEGWPGNRP